MDGRGEKVAACLIIVTLILGGHFSIMTAKFLSV